MQKLNLGCGKDVRRGPDTWVNVDYHKLPGVDVVANIRKALPFKDSEFDYVLCSHIVEHVTFEEKMPLISELWRITKPGGTIEIFCPNWSDRNAFIDPTHLSVWEIHTFDYFVPGHWANYYSNARFKIKLKEVRGDRNEELHWILEVIK